MIGFFTNLTDIDAGGENAQNRHNLVHPNEPAEYIDGREHKLERKNCPGNQENFPGITGLNKMY